MRVPVRKLLLGVLAATSLSAGAHAAIFDRTFDVTASDFVLSGGVGGVPPVDPVHLNFTLHFDNSIDILPTTTGLTVHTTNVGSFDFSHYAISDGVVIGTDVSWPSATCDGSVGTFCAFLHDVSSGSPTLAGFYQSVASTDPGWTNAMFSADTLSVTYHDTPLEDVGPGRGGRDPVPEPGTWALMLIGFGGLGGLLRSNRRRLLTV